MVKHGLTYGFIQKIAVLYLIIWTISPPLQVDTIFRIIALCCSGLWILCWFLRENPIIIEKDQFLAVVFLVFVLFVVYIENGDISYLIKQIAMIMLVLCYIINQYYKNDWSELRGIIPILLILLIIWNFITISALIEDPTIARRLIRDDDSVYDYLRQGVGGYSLIYPQVCICPVIYTWIISTFKNNKFKFIIGVIWLVSFAWVIFIAGYSIAVFSSVVGLFMLLFYKGKNGIAAFIFVLTIFVLSLLAILYIDSFREWLLEIFNGTAVEKKIIDLVSTSETGETGESIQVRINAYSNSLKTLFRYPLIGSLWRGGIGGHSAFLDTMCKYGFLGILGFSKMFYSVPVYYKKRYPDSKLIYVCNATLTTVLFVSCFDSFNYSFICMILLVAPLFFEDIILLNGELTNENSMGS